MTVLRFDDGVKVDTSGPYRIMHLHDGWYVVGEGDMCPCDDHAEAVHMLSTLNLIKRQRTTSNP